MTLEVSLLQHHLKNMKQNTTDFWEKTQWNVTSTKTYVEVAAKNGFSNQKTRTSATQYTAAEVGTDTVNSDNDVKLYTTLSFNALFWCHLYQQ